MDNEIIIAHPFKQHSFKTAEAVKMSNFSFKYITTVYAKKYSITYLLKKILKGKLKSKVNSHYCNALRDDDVIQFCELRGLIIMFMRRIDKSSALYYKLYNNLLKSFSKKVAKYAIKNNTKVVIMYDTLSYPTFKYIKKKMPDIITVMDMSAPFLPYMYEIYRNDVAENDNESETLRKEISSKGYLNVVKNALEETKWTDYYISASEFTNKSLTKFNIDSSRIFLCRYGINKIFNEVVFDYETKLKNDSKIKCVYTGNINQKKGMLVLEKVIKEVGTKYFSFYFLGRYDSNSNFYKKYKDECNFIGFVQQEELINKYKEMDLMIFPSLADGFGNSVLEAMACGIPVIVSSNAGISDIIIDGYNGYVINPNKYEEIVDKLILLEKDRELIKKLSIKARETALACKWKTYNENINKMLKNFLHLS